MLRKALFVRFLDLVKVYCQSSNQSPSTERAYLSQLYSSIITQESITLTPLIVYVPEMRKGLKDTVTLQKKTAKIGNLSFYEDA